MKIRIGLAAAAVLAAAFLFLLLPLPPRPAVMPPMSAQSPMAVGAFHVHTNRSGGSGSPEEVAAAAAGAGMQFVIITDHGDGTRRPDPPQYRSGVLVIDAVEISTAGGHYIAVGLPQAPYPLRGESRDVVEDVRRLGGFGVVAHPDSAKPSLRWDDWSAPIDGIEWLNADAEWRDETTLELAQALVRYPFRPAGTLASIIDRPDGTLARWDRLTQHHRIVALAGVDAHARMGWGDEDASGYRRGWFLRFPTYDTSFRTFALRVLLDRPLGHDAGADAPRLVDALRGGRLYSGIDAIASPANLEFSASADGRVVSQGGSVETGGAVSFAIRSGGSGGVIVLRRDGAIVMQSPMPKLEFQSAESGTYRVEIYLSRASGDPPVPWIVSNPIYVRPAGWGTRVEPTYPASADGWSIQGGPWQIEKDGRSTAQVAQPDAPEGPVEVTYRLAEGERMGQYAALVLGVGNALTDRTRLSFRGRAPQPMRISIQARRPRSGERWQRSVYLDTTPRQVVVPFSDLTPAGTSTLAFDPRLADTILFVVDTTNTQPGASGSFSISELRLER